jgi:hypothetical protein
VAEVPNPELVENRRRSIAMLPSGAPALNREEIAFWSVKIVPVARARVLGECERGEGERDGAVVVTVWVVVHPQHSR